MSKVRKTLDPDRHDRPTAAGGRPSRIIQAGDEATEHEPCSGPGACRHIPWQLADGSWAMSHPVNVSMRPQAGLAIEYELTSDQSINPRTVWYGVVTTYADDAAYLAHVRAERIEEYLASHPDARPRKMAGWRVGGHELRTLEAIRAEAARRGLRVDVIDGRAVLTGDVREDGMYAYDRFAAILAAVLPALAAEATGAPMPPCVLCGEPAAGLVIDGLVCVTHRDTAMIEDDVPKAVTADIELPAVHVEPAPALNAFGQPIVGMIPASAEADEPKAPVGSARRA
jgi:hypothetical protein